MIPFVISLDTVRNENIRAKCQVDGILMSGQYQLKERKRDRRDETRTDFGDG